MEQQLAFPSSLHLLREQSRTREEASPLGTEGGELSLAWTKAPPWLFTSLVGVALNGLRVTWCEVDECRRDAVKRGCGSGHGEGL